MPLIFTAALACAAYAEPGAVVVAVPDRSRDAHDIASRALGDAVEHALPVAARERGLRASRTQLVAPVDEAARACAAGDDACRIHQAKRMGARYALLARQARQSLELTLVDVESPEARERVRIDGAPMFVLAQVPSAVDALLERVAPRREQQVREASARLRAARIDERHADAALACAELAQLALTNEERVEWLLQQAHALASTAEKEAARAQFLRIAADESASEDVRVDALAQALLLR